ncbi:ABC transporter permease [Aquabacter sp. CN5-332]|uniref:ABC transporter permease n=1 Tax=Aquabacter sp. CN5-332 TaxID=3156608 RepID=UPI0032B31483
MLQYTFRRVLYAIPIALAVSLVCFLLVHIAPGDPIDAILPPDASAETVAMVRKDYGLDKPLPIQFGLWLMHVVQGDFGRSIANRRLVSEELVSAAGKTFILASSAAGLGFVIGCVLGGLAAAFRGTWVDRLAVGFAVGGVSVPHYWLGMVLVIIFSVLLGWLPSIGAGPGDWAWNWAHIRHLILPAVTLSVIPAGLVTRTVRGVVVEILSQDFMTTLKGKGLNRARVMLHVVKNAAPSALAVMGLQLGYLMGGSILVETVFAWPGTGMMLNQAIFQRDIPMLQGATLVLAMIFVALNLIVDLIQTALDPRMRRT